MLRIYEGANRKTAIQFIDYVFEKLPSKIEVAQTDNGAEFASATGTSSAAGINHIYIKPRTLRLNGKVERSHRIDGRRDG